LKGPLEKKVKFENRTEFVIESGPVQYEIDPKEGSEGFSNSQKLI